MSLNRDEAQRSFEDLWGMISSGLAADQRPCLENIGRAIFSAPLASETFLIQIFRVRRSLGEDWMGEQNVWPRPAQHAIAESYGCEGPKDKKLKLNK